MSSSIRRRTPRQGQQGQQGQQDHQAQLSMARWMVQQQRTTGGPWDMYQSRNYAELWYGARAAGERMRAITLERLYSQRPEPGGRHPDPREPAAFSSQAVLAVASSLLELRISPLLFSTPLPGADTNVDEETGQPLPYAWIITYTAPTHPQEAQRRPEIALRTLHGPHQEMQFEIACLLGYWHHEYSRLHDTDAPGGIILMSRDPGVVALLHQYAIALLGLPKDCPRGSPCHCNGIRERFNAPPPDHLHPTGVFTLDDLEREKQRRPTNTEPQFPYPDNNVWTQSQTGE